MSTEEFSESKIYDDLSCHQRKGNIQIFSDPMSGDYLYFGYVFFESDDTYEDVMYSVLLAEISDIIPKVYEKYAELKLDIIDNSISPKMIVFHEYT